FTVGGDRRADRPQSRQAAKLLSGHVRRSREGGGDTTLASRQKADNRESSQPPPTRVSVRNQTTPEQRDIEFGNDARAVGSSTFGQQMISAPRRSRSSMSETTCHMSISLDGFVAGPNQSPEPPRGRRGTELHQWHLDEPLHDADASARDLLLRPRGAYVMGRNMFGPIRGPWLEDWRGWWGDEPPYHAPVFVLTHYEHEPIELEGGTIFHFVTDGFYAAFSRA